jgi:hypothetical protein
MEGAGAGGPGNARLLHLSMMGVPHPTRFSLGGRASASAHRRLISKEWSALEDDFRTFFGAAA